MTMLTLKNAADILSKVEPLLDVRQSIHVKVHPDAARALLEINTKNRVLAQRRVEVLVRALHENRWKLINNGIGVDTNGDLVDGQHRLTAVVLADTAAEFYLTTGLAPEVRSVIDIGKARSFADTLAVQGYGRGRSNEAAAVQLLYRYENDLLQVQSSGGLPVPHDVLLKFFSSLEQDVLLRASSDATSASRNVRGFNRSALTALLYLTYLRDPFEGAAFAERLKTGEHLRSGDPELTLRNKVGRMERERNSWHFVIYLKAWNARRDGRKVQVLDFRSTESMPEVH